MAVDTWSSLRLRFFFFSNPAAVLLRARMASALAPLMYLERWARPEGMMASVDVRVRAAQPTGGR